MIAIPKIMRTCRGHAKTSIDRVRMLVVVEGPNDIEFLRRISLILHSHDSSLPHLPELEQTGELIFIPSGGNLTGWSQRLAPLGRNEFHLVDHELPPETEQRKTTVAEISARPGCEARLTRKRSLENYLHPAAIAAAGIVDVTFGDFDPVAEIVAKAVHQASLDESPWELLSHRRRSRLAQRAKRWLNTRAADRMTTAMLRERDPLGEVDSWLRTIGRLAAGV